MLTQTFKRPFSFLLGILLLVGLVACTLAAEPTVSDNQLVGTNWSLVTMNGAAVQEGMTLSFSADTVSGSDGCNSFTGGYTVENGALVIADNLASTAMACPDMDEVMSRQYLDALLSISSYTFDDDSLTFQTENGELVFEPLDDNATNNAGIDTMVNPLVTTHWNLVSIDGVNVNSNMTLSFNPETVSGSDSCNTFSGDYTVSSDGTLDISDNLISTTVACPDVDTSMVQSYLNALASATGFMHNGDSLTIQTENGELVFTQMPNVELDGTRWQLNSLADGSGNITRMPIDSDIFIIFDGDQVNGSGGCNSFSGEATIENPQMSFGNIAATLMACADEDVNQREGEFFAALNNVSTYEIVGQTLTLYDADGATVATFTATAVE